MISGRNGNLPITEPVPIDDVFVTGIASIEKRGDFFRLNFASERTLFDGGSGLDEAAVVSRLVCTPCRLKRIVRSLQKLIEDRDLH